ncbi:MAG TPA: phage tail protein [Methylophilaceae bacterium]|nr:phage tail protein [Methylophilaceae bacterium]
MSDFTYQPAFGMSVRRQPRVNSSRLGDGYEQRTGDGINNDLRVWDMTFNRTLADIDAIDTFLQGKGGATSFTWTPTGETEVRVICRQWSRTKVAPNVGTLSASFEEVPA